MVTEDHDVDTARGQPATSMQIFLTVLAAAVFIGVVTGSMLNVVLPIIRADFQASPAEVSWIVTGFSLAYAAGIPLYGKVSTVFGVRRLFALGLLGFAAGGVICALAPNLPILVLGRVVQGLGGSAVTALATIAVAMVLPPGARGGALGIIASSVGLGQVAGPIAGGAVGQLADWRVLFASTLVLALLIIPGVLWVLPEGSRGGPYRIDFAGAALMGMAAGLLLFGVTQVQAAGIASISSWGSLLGGTVATAGFAYRITHSDDPFISPRLFENRAFVAASVVAFLAMFAYLSTIILAPLLVIEENGLAAATAGLVLTPGAVAIALLSPLSGRLSDRLGGRIPILSGLVVMGLSVFYLSSFGAGASPLHVSLGMFGLGVGFGLLSSPLSNAAANTLAPDQIGEGLGVYQALFFLGGGIGAAITTAVLAARRAGQAEAVNPLYALDAAPFSDVFLVTTVVVAAALLVAARGLLQGTAKGGRSNQTARPIPASPARRTETKRS